jgi:hypothetical protein
MQSYLQSHAKVIKCGSTSTSLRCLRLLLFNSERFTEGNEGNEEEVEASENSISHPCPEWLGFLAGMWRGGVASCLAE